MSERKNYPVQSWRVRSLEREILAWIEAHTLIVFDDLDMRRPRTIDPHVQRIRDIMERGSHSYLWFPSPLGGWFASPLVAEQEKSRDKLPPVGDFTSLWPGRRTETWGSPCAECRGTGFYESDKLCGGCSGSGKRRPQLRDKKSTEALDFHPNGYPTNPHIGIGEIRITPSDTGGFDMLAIITPQPNFALSTGNGPPYASPLQWVTI